MNERRPKRILMLLENCPYPRDVRVRNEANSLVAAHYEVTVVAQAMKGEKYHEMVNGVRVYRYPAPLELPSFLGFAFEYAYSYVVALFYSAWILIRHGFDVIHAHNPPDIYVFIAIFYKLLGKKFVFDHHDLTPEVFMALFNGEGNKTVYNILMFMERFSLRVADKVIATNESYRARQINVQGTPPEKITIVRNGPNLKRFRPVDFDPELRAKAGTILGYAGTMGKQDGIDYLIRSVHHLVKDLGETDVYCVIMGSGNEEAKLKQLTKDLGMEKYIWFPGWMEVDTLIKYLSTADICLGPDPKNSFNDHSTMIKLMEYMAMAKPIVSFDLTESIFSARDAAVYIKDNNEMAFAEAIRDLMYDPDKRERMGQAGYQRIHNELAWKYSAKNLLSLYASLFPDMAAATVETEETEAPADPEAVS